MKPLFLPITAIATFAVTLHGSVILSDTFDDLSVGPLTRTANAKLRVDDSGPTYLVSGSSQAGLDGAAFAVVDADGIGGNFSGKALEFNFITNTRFLYLPFANPGWNDGDKIRVTFDFAYSVDPGDQATSLWIALHCQRDNVAGVADFTTADAIFQDDSGHGLKIAEKTAGALSGAQYGFVNARMTSTSGNFYNGPTGLDPFIAATAPVRVAYEIEKVPNSYFEEGTLISGTRLSIYINDEFVDSAPITAPVVGGYYDALAIWARGTGRIDNLSITYNAETLPPQVPVGVAVALSGVADIVLSFESVAGQAYQLEKSVDGMGSWQPVGNPELSVAGGPLQLQDDGGRPAVGERVFYRVSVSN